jgi:Xaa-Pro aminopeptidase
LHWNWRFFLEKMEAKGWLFRLLQRLGKMVLCPMPNLPKKALEKGDLITFDFGCKVSGYCSDMTRTVALGMPDEQLREIYEITLTAQQKALEVIGPGLTGIEVDKQAREYIRSKGYGENFGHGLGHGVGLNVHEAPTLSPRGKTCWNLAWWYL